MSVFFIPFTGASLELDLVAFVFSSLAPSVAPGVLNICRHYIANLKNLRCTAVQSVSAEDYTKAVFATIWVAYPKR